MGVDRTSPAAAQVPTPSLSQRMTRFSVGRTKDRSFAHTRAGILRSVLRTPGMRRE